MTFAETVEIGHAAEEAISRWLRDRNCTVIPAYEKIIDTGKGPQVYTPKEALIAPDLLTITGARRILWVEAKQKTAFTWHRITGRWTTGIDLHHYEHYQQVEEATEWPVWLLFLQLGGQAKDSPPNSPAGLFGNSLAYLREHENHRNDNWGPSGMVYWAHEELKRFAELGEVQRFLA